MLHRRKFLIGFLAAPAIVHAGNLMPIKALAPEKPWTILWFAEDIGEKLSAEAARELKAALDWLKDR